MARDDDKILIQATHKFRPEWGIGNFEKLVNKINSKGKWFRAPDGVLWGRSIGMWVPAGGGELLTDEKLAKHCMSMV